MAMNKFLDLLKETRNGKTIARTLFNWEVAEKVQNITGVIVDLGGGKNPSYRRYWDIKPEKFIRVDISDDALPDIAADIKKSLPFSDNFADAVFLFSVIYIVEDPTKVLSEIYRILKPGGKLFLTSPFIFNEAREPDDYYRFASQGLYKILKDAGFKEFSIKPIGERFTAAAYLLTSFMFFWPIKFIFYSTTILFDKLIPKKFKSKYPAPIGYFVTAEKR